MKDSLLFCLLLLSLSLSLNHARLSPLSSPISAPFLPPQSSILLQPQHPISLPSYWPANGPSGPQIDDGNEKNGTLEKELLLVIIVMTSALVLIIISSLGVWICCRSACRGGESKDVQSSDTSRGSNLVPILRKLNSLRMKGKKVPVSLMDCDVLDLATNNFCSNNILSEGGSGYVYKARFDDNLFAAVKRLDNAGPECQQEFENEVNLMKRISHPNLVSLLGYAIRGETRLLVYELMQNGTLESQLHGPSRGSLLTWHIRIKIAVEAARGLEFLHERCHPPVVHSNLKSSNILLDSNFNAKLSDFGLAHTVGRQDKANMELLGTLGLLAPEYIFYGKLTEKSDVYAFGVILLELLLGRKPIEKLKSSRCQSIVAWAMPQLTDRLKLQEIIDPVIRNTMNLKHLYQVAAVALLCVQPEPSYRPLITDVLHSLLPLVPVELGGTLRVSENGVCDSDAL